MRKDRSSGHQRSRLTQLEAAGSLRLLGLVLASNIPLDEVARVAGCARNMVKKWIGRQNDLAPEYQKLIRAHFGIDQGPA